MCVVHRESVPLCLVYVGVKGEKVLSRKVNNSIYGLMLCCTCTVRSHVHCTVCEYYKMRSFKWVALLN